ncbi:Uncharacterised protein [BD1-7 clade bacterium]|uniref:Uncharacterized protein n=1 Tax=BD1-7 clade bacterium TaxID=2029982 RepID=A0A5S9PKI2_9GAMM|nr:Uncharacterised protein [BD1-7 clade bacterium]
MNYFVGMRALVLGMSGLVLAACVPDPVVLPTEQTNENGSGEADFSASSLLQTGGIYFSSLFTSYEATTFRGHFANFDDPENRDVYRLAMSYEHWQLDGENQSNHKIVYGLNLNDDFDINAFAMPIVHSSGPTPEEAQIFSYNDGDVIEITEPGSRFTIDEHGTVAIRYESYPWSGLDLIAQPLPVAGNTIPSGLSWAIKPGAVFRDDAKALHAQLVYADNRLYGFEVPVLDGITFCTPVYGMLGENCTNNLNELIAGPADPNDGGTFFLEDGTIEVVYDGQRQHAGNWSQKNLENGDTLYVIGDSFFSYTPSPATYTLSILLSGGKIYWGKWLDKGTMLVLSGSSFASTISDEDPRAKAYSVATYETTMFRAWNKTAVEDIAANLGVAFGKGRTPWGRETWIQYERFPDCTNADEIGDVPTAYFHVGFMNGVDGVTSDIHEFWFNYSVEKSNNDRDFSSREFAQKVVVAQDGSCSLTNADFVDETREVTGLPLVMGEDEITTLLSGFYDSPIEKTSISVLFEFSIETATGMYAFKGINR